MLFAQADQRLRHVLQNPCDTCDQSDLCLSGGPDPYKRRGDYAQSYWDTLP